MTSSKKRRRPTAKREDIARHERESMRRDERTREISAAVRVVLLLWEIVWTLVREHVLRGTGPGRPL